MFTKQKYLTSFYWNMTQKWINLSPMQKEKIQYIWLIGYFYVLILS